ncbi:MAG TPA: hypothetical protein PLN42_12920 [Anaerolineae bacterium]|nr:hypothetical protein [Anaerolineae bacterium]
MSFLTKAQMLGQKAVQEFRAADVAWHFVDKPDFGQDGAWYAEGSLGARTMKVALIRVHDAGSLLRNQQFEAAITRIVKEADWIDLDERTLDRIRAFDVELSLQLSERRRMW